MSRFALKCRDYIDTPAGKRTYNARLFTAIADEYSSMSKVLSLGRDHAWKRALVNGLPDAPAPKCLDLACGNGDICRLLGRRFPSGSITGLDLTGAMLDRARQQGLPANVSLVQADMCQTGLPSGFFDIITGGYALRNAPVLETCIEETARLLKTGGCAAFLDFSRPDSKLLRMIEWYILSAWGSLWGVVRSGNADTYRYIAESLSTFPNRSSLHQALRAGGLEVRSTARHFFGFAETLFAVRMPSL